MSNRRIPILTFNFASYRVRHKTRPGVGGCSQVWENTKKYQLFPLSLKLCYVFEGVNKRINFSNNDFDNWGVQGGRRGIYRFTKKNVGVRQKSPQLVRHWRDVWRTTQGNYDLYKRPIIAILI